MDCVSTQLVTRYLSQIAFSQPLRNVKVTSNARLYKRGQ